MGCRNTLTGVGAADFLAIDSFADTNGTSLPSHVPNLGPAWSADLGGDANLVIQSNQATKSASGSAGNKLTIDRTSDFSVSVDWIPTAAELSVSYEVFLELRCDSGYVNRFQAGLQGNGNLFISTVFNATFTSRASTSIGALSAGNRYTIKATFAGDTLTVSVNGANPISYTDTTNNTNGFITQLIANSADTNQIAAQNFQLTSP
jgi:hypothetical protein